LYHLNANKLIVVLFYCEADPVSLQVNAN